MDDKSLKLGRMDYIKKSDAEIVGRGHINPGGDSYLPGRGWKLVLDAMSHGLQNRIFELKLEIINKQQGLDLLKSVQENPEKYFNKEEING